MNKKGIKLSEIIGDLDKKEIINKITQTTQKTKEQPKTKIKQLIQNKKGGGY
jgi:hypothetical protein